MLLDSLGQNEQEFPNNTINELTDLLIRANIPYPYCLFQYFAPDSDQFEDFEISFTFDNATTAKRILRSIHHLTTHCKFAHRSAFQNSFSSFVNQQIIASPYQLADHTIVCYCPQSSHPNCSVDYLGPIYPGQMLDFELCLPYNKKESGILYTETHNINLPKSACKINDYNSISHNYI